MKKILLILFLCAMHQVGTAQKYIPILKNNTTLSYICKLHGQTRTLTLPEALKNGNALSFNQGEYAPVFNLKPTETFFMISQSAYQDVVKNNKFIYNNTTYVLDQNQGNNNVEIEGKGVDALHVVAEIDETEMWIVKNPEFPLICKIMKNPLGINFTLVKVADKN